MCENDDDDCDEEGKLLVRLLMKREDDRDVASETETGRNVSTNCKPSDGVKSATSQWHFDPEQFGEGFGLSCRLNSVWTCWPLTICCSSQATG